MYYILYYISRDITVKYPKGQIWDCAICSLLLGDFKFFLIKAGYIAAKIETKGGKQRGILS